MPNHSAELVAHRNRRAAASPVVLRGAYRLLFPLGALWALAVVALWIPAFAGSLTLPTAMDPLAWHQHEMLFGYLGAVIGGFLAAAIPNWTGRPAYSGPAVAFFVLLWVAARLANLFSAGLPWLVAPVLDVGFLLLLALAAGREVIGARNRNVPIVLVILLFALANAFHHAEALGAAVPYGLGMRAGFAIVLILIALIGGRIIPAFTRNWLVQQGRAAVAPGPAGRFDLVAIGAAALALAGWVALPFEPVVGFLLLAAAVLHAWRLARWSGHHTARDPMVLILHVAYAWLPAGLALLGASLLFPAIPSTVGAHALAAGCMASMTLAVMTRASLGHTGRPLVADTATRIIYLLVTAGALLRVAGPLLPFDYAGILHLSGAAWGGAFLLFILSYGPKLLAPRVDGRP